MADGSISDALHVCKTCGAAFKRRRGQNLHCSQACRRAAEHAKRQSFRHTNGVRLIGAMISCGRCGQEVMFRGRRHFYCDPCSVVRRKEKSAVWRARNPERRKEVERARAQKRKKDDAARERQRHYFTQLSREKRRDPRHRLDHRMGQMVRNAMRGQKGGRKWEAILGFSVATLMAHLERQFSPGMGWHNIGEWHVDHIRPRAMFSYVSTDDFAFKECWALSNLRPLWAGDNLSKGSQRLHLI